MSYDGAAPILVKRYTADAVAKVESLALNPPAGAPSARMRFRYAGDNNWFWAVDDVHVS